MIAADLPPLWLPSKPAIVRADSLNRHDRRALERDFGVRFPPDKAMLPGIGGIMAGVPRGIGGNDSYTKLLLHCDGADASTTFTDSSASAHTLTAVGNAQIDTAQSVFGGGAGLFDGTGDELTIPDSAVFDFGAGEFTVDFRIRFVATTDQVFIGDIPGGTGVGSWCVFFATGALKIVYNSNVTLSNAWTPSTNTWYHVAVLRTGTNLMMFVDGTQIGSTQAFSATLDTGARTWHIGAFTDAQYYVNGWIDELRVSNVARWTANFTPPTEAYS